MRLSYNRMLFEDDIDIPQLTRMYCIPEVARYLSIGENYFQYVTNTENVYFYKVYRNAKLVGAIHLEVQGGVLFMSIIVFPEFQRNGIATKIVKDIQEDFFGLAYDKIVISIDERNIGSLRLFENAGFVCISKETDLLHFVYTRGT